MEQPSRARRGRSSRRLGLGLTARTPTQQQTSRRSTSASQTRLVLRVFATLQPPPCAAAVPPLVLSHTSLRQALAAANMAEFPSAARVANSIPLETPGSLCHPYQQPGTLIGGPRPAANPPSPQHWPSRSSLSSTPATCPSPPPRPAALSPCMHGCLRGSFPVHLPHPTHHRPCTLQSHPARHLTLQPARNSLPCSAPTGTGAQSPSPMPSPVDRWICSAACRFANRPP